MAAWTSIKTDGGTVRVAATSHGLCSVTWRGAKREFVRELRRDFPGRVWREDPSHPVLARAAEQLQGYFRRELARFDLPLDISGSPFERATWQAVREIPWGESRSYREVAASIGRPRAMRAVGNAMNKCRLGIVIPCHRVVGARGRLGGWGGDPSRKQWLLDFERASPFPPKRLARSAAPACQ